MTKVIRNTFFPQELLTFLTSKGQISANKGKYNKIRLHVGKYR